MSIHFEVFFNIIKIIIVPTTRDRISALIQFLKVDLFSLQTLMAFLYFINSNNLQLVIKNFIYYSKIIIIIKITIITIINHNIYSFMINVHPYFKNYCKDFHNKVIIIIVIVKDILIINKDITNIRIIIKVINNKIVSSLVFMR